MGISHGARKAKGSMAERELLHMFWAAGWGATRAAGSGSVPLPSPDLLVGHASRTLALECKAIASDKKYFPKKEIDELIEFCARFGCEGWVALRRNRKGWVFLLLEDLRDCGKSYVIDSVLINLKGVSFEEISK
jgi:Holliday junction resolvase